MTALRDRNGTLNRECIKVYPTPGLRFGTMNVRGQGVARAFDERLLLFSRQQTFGPSGAATHRPATREPRREPRPVERAVRDDRVWRGAIEDDGICAAPHARAIRRRSS